MRIWAWAAALLLTTALAVWGMLAGVTSVALVAVFVLLGLAVVPILGLRFDRAAAEVAIPDKTRAQQSKSILDIARESMSWIGSGLTPESAAAVCALIQRDTGAAAVAITDREKVLGFQGVAADHHKVGGPIVTQATRDAIARNERRIMVDRDEIGCPDPKCPLRAAIVVPLTAGDQAIGTLKFYYTDPKDLHETAIVLAEGLAHLFSTQLELDSSRRELSFLAEHDPLTGLSNRRRFETELSKELSEQRRLGGAGAVLWFDLDNFKDINDSLGHAAGDQLLATIAEVLRETSRSYDVVARLGGDEFGVLIPHADRAEATQAAARLRRELASHAFHVVGQEVHVTASMGMVCYPEHGQCREDLLARADLAMYEAKGKGGDELIIYEPGEAGHDQMSKNAEWASAISSALRDDRFCLDAQPIRSLVGGTDVAYEMLLRMVGEDGQLVDGDEFLPVAERTGLIGGIDRWVARRAIQLLAEEKAQARDTVLAINVSQHAFADHALLDIMRVEFASTAVAPSRLIVEISESAVVADITGAAEFVRSLRELGCRFALDHVGSGSSLFFYLEHLGADFLKFDSDLIKGLERDGGPTDAALIRALVGMCKAMRIPTVAESVGNANLLHVVAAQGVDYVQGEEVGPAASLGSQAASGPIVA